MKAFMRKWRFAAGLLLAILPTAAWAQYPGVVPQGINPAARPTYSPWLNLNRPGGNLAQNYYGLVRPDFRTFNSIQQLQQQQQTLALQPPEARNYDLLPATGHVTGFLNHTKYFMNRGGATPLANRVAAATPVVAAPQPAAAPKRTR
jgi:hypothetical protein